jgi:hypothetical protein
VLVLYEFFVQTKMKSRFPNTSQLDLMPHKLQVILGFSVRNVLGSLLVLNYEKEPLFILV